jgi:hypothetical protein
MQKNKRERDRDEREEKSKKSQRILWYTMIFKAPTHHMTRPVSILRGVQIYLSGTR